MLNKCLSSALLPVMSICCLLLPEDAQAQDMYWTQAIDRTDTAVVLKTLNDTNGVQKVEVVAQRGEFVPRHLSITGSSPPNDSELWVALIRSPHPGLASAQDDEVHIAYATLEVDTGHVLTPPLSSLEDQDAEVPLSLFLDGVEAAYHYRQGIQPSPRQLSRLSDCITKPPATKTSDPEAIRRFCVGTLASTGTMPSSSAIQTLLDSEISANRFYGLWALIDHQRRYPSSQAEVQSDLLKQALSDSSPAVQSLAAHELLRQRDPGMVPAAKTELMWSAQDDDIAYFPLGRPAVHLPSPRIIMARSLGYLDDSPEGAELLYLQLQSSNREVAFSSLRSLERRNDQNLVPSLLDLLEGDDPQLDYLIIRALGRIGDTRALPALIQISSDASSTVSAKTQAVRAMGMIGDSDAVPYLIAAIHHSDRQVALAAAHALGKLGEPSACLAIGELLLRPLTYEDFEGVLRALSTLGGPEALAVLNNQLGREVMPQRRKGLNTAVERIESMSNATLNDVIRHELLVNASATSPEQLKALRWAVDVSHTHRLTTLAPLLHEVFRRLAHQPSPQREAISDVLQALNHLEEPLNEFEQTLLNTEEERLGLNL